MSSNKSNVKKLKEELLLIAESGQPRPCRVSKCLYEKGLALAFSNFIFEKYNEFDASFADKIKSLRPDWFTSEHVINKSALIRAAENNIKSPQINFLIGLYFVKSSRHYDAKLFEEVETNYPEWFKSMKCANLKGTK